MVEKEIEDKVRKYLKKVGFYVPKKIPLVKGHYELYIFCKKMVLKRLDIEIEEEAELLGVIA